MVIILTEYMVQSLIFNSTEIIFVIYIYAYLAIVMFGLGYEYE